MHIVVSDDGDRDVIANSVQLIAGRTGQEYNQRKQRKGAFWEDRYHATAIECDEHLISCMLYVDMNMVRAGVVKHPRQWPFCGFHEISSPRLGYAIIDHRKLVELLRMKDLEGFQKTYSYWLDEILRGGTQGREGKWTEAIAVGGKEFVDTTAEKLGFRAKGRDVKLVNGGYELREPDNSYSSDFDPENEALSNKNAYYWNESPEIST